MSGVWTAYKTTSPEDQRKFIVPLNRDTEKIYHDLRMIIDAGVLSEPVVWEITKIHRLAPNGLVRATLAQTRFDENRDYIEVDDKGNVIGMWADFYKQIPQKPIVVSDIYSVITFSGVQPQVKIGGNYKKFTVTFYNKDQEVVDFENGDWSYFIRRNPNTPDETVEDASSLVTILTDKTSSDVNENQIKLRFDGGDMYLGDILIIKYTSTSNIVGSVEMEIVGL